MDAPRIRPADLIGVACTAVAVRLVYAAVGVRFDTALN